MKRFAAEITACLLIVLALGLLSVWFARRRDTLPESVTACERPVEILGPVGAALWCARDQAQLDAVLAQAGAPGCADSVGPTLLSIRAETAQVRLQADCVPVEVREGVLSGRAALLLGVPLDLNLADARDIAELPGIGDKMAARIVEDRTKNGPFCSVEQLDRVKGIGKKTVERLGPMLQARCP